MTDKNKYFLSIVIPYYNSERSIIDIYNNINSVINKLDFSFEIIIIDDCSKKIISNKDIEITNAIENLSYERLIKNEGQSYATGLGITKSNSEIILTLDDDIVLDFNFISTILNQYAATNSDILYCVRKTNLQHNKFRRYLIIVVKWMLYIFFKKRASSIRVLNKKIKQPILNNLNKKYFTLDKIFYKECKKISYMYIDILSIGKSRYNFFKLLIVLKNYFKFDTNQQ